MRNRNIAEYQKPCINNNDTDSDNDIDNIKKEEEILRRKEFDSLVQLICILSEDVKMKFGLEKCAFFCIEVRQKGL